MSPHSEFIRFPYVGVNLVALFLIFPINTSNILYFQEQLQENIVVMPENILENRLAALIKLKSLPFFFVLGG